MDSAPNVGTMHPVHVLPANVQLAQSRRPLLLVTSLATALILLRSFVWVFFEQSFFDSDQAVIGLMAKHLAEGRAFPLFFYGQHYMLGVESWLVAPVFLLAGASIATLKLPLLMLNVVIAAVLLWLLVRKAHLQPFESLIIILFFVVPTPLVAARLLEAQGSNIEPLLYVLVLWLFRAHPIAFGLLAGLAFLHREFAAYAVAAVVLLDMVTGRAFSRERVRDYTTAWGMFALVVFVVSALKMRAADLLGPGTAGMIDEGGFDAHMASWGQFVCWPPTELVTNLRWLGHENLGTIFNWRPDLLGPENWTRTPAGHAWMWIPMLAMVGVAGAEVFRRRREIRNWELGAFLMLVAVQSAFAYAVLGCHVRDGALIRYTLLTLFFPIGLLALFAGTQASRWSRAFVFGCVGIWVVCSAADNGRFLAAYLHRPPPSPARDLADFLESQGVRYARGTYWVAYQLDFLTQERITVSSLDKVRVEEYQKVADAHDQQTVHILPNPGWPNHNCEVGVTYRLWCLQYLDRASHVAPQHAQQQPLDK
jgi:hypothetical protein